MPVDLSGLYILNTRPAHQAGQLQNAIDAAGGQSINAPLLAISDIEDASTLINQLAQLHSYDMAVFVSPNAVEYGFKYLKQAGLLPIQFKLAAVGKTTAGRLAELSSRDDIICPHDEFTSEALLTLPDMQEIAGKRIMIFRGQQGRELLAETLRQRGAKVDYAAVYQRSVPTESAQILRQNIQKDAIDIIIITSAEALHNLVDMAGKQLSAKLQQLQLLVVNKKQADKAETYGFHKAAIISDNATDDAIISAIQHWQETRSGSIKAQ